MNTEEYLDKACKKSKEYLSSISALELMEQALCYTKDLERLAGSQCLPNSILIGCLNNEIQRLNGQCDDLLEDAKFMKAFKFIKKYVDKNFMKKEE